MCIRFGVWFAQKQKGRKIKLGSLVKYKGRVKTKVLSLGVEVGSFYFNPKK
jgi:hypothetical protein